MLRFIVERRNALAAVSPLTDVFALSTRFSPWVGCKACGPLKKDGSSNPRRAALGLSLTRSYSLNGPAACCRHLALRIKLWIEFHGIGKVSD